MGPRTGTPMRLVSPAPVLVPPGAARAGPPPQGPPQLYPPQPQTAQQNLYSQQNGSSVGGKKFLHQILLSICNLYINISICNLITLCI